MDGAESQDYGSRAGRRRAGKRPPDMEFMFIDSSTHGQNAKPDKAVRSFVMHQARRTKPWSTRQKTAQTPKPATASSEQPSISRNADRAEGFSPDGSGPWQIDPSPHAWDAHPLGSPVSRVGSTINSTSANIRRMSLTPTSSHGSVCDLPHCTGSCGRTHLALARRDGFALGLGVLDPFDCLPIRTDTKTSSLIHHWKTNVSPHLIPMDLHRVSDIATSQWLANSLRNTTSAPFTYALLYSSSFHMGALGKPNLADVLYYKGMAISEINRLLSDPKTRVNDDNIAAVFMLLCLEESQLVPSNDPKENDASQLQREVHLNGLTAMIQQRGGLAGLSSNRCLQVFLLMHSIAHSISTFQRPYATILDGNGLPQRYDLPSFRSRPTSARTLRPFRDLKTDTDLLEIITNIAVFIGDVSVYFEERKCPIEPLDLQKHVNLLLYRLYDWYMRPYEETAAEERSPIDESICLALIVFLVKVTQPLDPAAQAMIFTTAKKLRASLTKGSIFRWARSQDLLLWTLTMGVLAARGTPELAFFSQYCSVAFADAGFDDRTNVDELLQRMKNCLWIPLLFDAEAKKMWVQTGLVRGERVIETTQEREIRPEIKDDDVVGLLMTTRFFSEKKSKK